MTAPRLRAVRKTTAPAFTCLAAIILFAGCLTAPTPTPTPTAAPTPTPTPTPTATPTPAPAAYLIESGGAAFTGDGPGTVKTEFSLSITNQGGLPGEEFLPLQVEVDDNEPIVIRFLPGLAPGQTASFAVARALAPGDRLVTFTAGGARLPIPLRVPTADVAVALLEHNVTGDGSITLDVRVENLGDLPARAIVLSAAWAPAPGSPGLLSGSVESLDAVDLLAPGESRAVSLPIDIPAGAYDFTLTAATQAIEAFRENNAVAASIAVDYVDLAVAVGEVAYLGYEDDGDGIAAVSLLVANQGVAPSGPIDVGIACPDEPPDGCSQRVSLGSIPPGGEASTAVTSAFPQGETAVLLFAGALDDGYRWGSANVLPLTLDVPVKPPVSLVLDAAAAVSGYWSDGTVDVELAASLANEGYRAFTDPQPLTVACLRDGETLDDCGAARTVELPDGRGPAFAAFTVRVPVGETVFEVSTGGGQSVTAAIDAPERILGVDPEVWACFSDRPGEFEQRGPGDRYGGCGGWASETVEKWDQSAPVAVWATGSAAYERVLRKAVDDLAPLLRLEFEWVDSEDDADLRAYVGVPSSWAAGIGFSSCAEAWGCATLGPGGATIAVWTLDSDRLTGPGRWEELIEHVTVHELLHALGLMVHRDSPASIMNVHDGLSLPTLSPMGEALLRLHSHPLVRHGMTMPEIEELIVFSGDLLDPPQPEEADAYEVIRSVYAALQRSGSARFTIRGGWTRGGCNEGFRRVEYAIGSFDPFPQLIHYTGSREFAASYDPEAGTYSWYRWSAPRERWTPVTRESVYRQTDWEYGLSSIYTVLATLLQLTDAAGIGLEERPDGALVLNATADDANLALSWSRGEILEVEIVLDRATYAIAEYRAAWLFDVSSRLCPVYQTIAADGEYGVEIDLPGPLPPAS